MRRIIFERDFSEISIKGRQAQGVILTRLPVHKIALKQKGGSTLGGRKVWFDRDILRLNYDGRGEYLGEFQSDDTILVVLNNGDFYTSNFDLSNHYEDNVSIVEKFDSNKVWTAALYDADQQNYPYLKRFCFEGSNRKQNYLGENKNNRLILLTDEFYPRLEVSPLTQWRRLTSSNRPASPNRNRNRRKRQVKNPKIWTRTVTKAKGILLMKSPGR